MYIIIVHFHLVQNCGACHFSQPVLNSPPERKNQRVHLCVTVDNPVQGHMIFPGMRGK